MIRKGERNFLPTHDTVLSAGDAVLVVTDAPAADGKQLGQLQAHAGPVTGVAFNPASTQFLTVGGDGLLKVWGLPFELAAVIGAAAATFLGVVFGYVAIRRQGLYFAMITLALAQMINFLALQLPFTHAEDGLTGVPRGRILGLFDLNNLYVLYYTAAVIFVAGYLLIYRITNSTFAVISASTDGKADGRNDHDGDHHEEDDDHHENDDRQRRPVSAALREESGRI